MSIKDGEIASSDEVMNAMGSIFNDAAQNLFNADYIGFDSRLTNSTTPNLKNVKYSTFTSDDADVSTNLTYNGTEDSYQTDTLNAVATLIVKDDASDSVTNAVAIFNDTVSDAGSEVANGITPTESGTFSTSATNLANITDGDFSNPAGTAITTETVGYLTFDLGDNLFRKIISAKVDFVDGGFSNIEIFVIEYSEDNSNWTKINETSLSADDGTGVYNFSVPVNKKFRYVRFKQGYHVDINATFDYYGLEVGSSSTAQISISADGGSNWTDVDNAEIARPTAGIELWRRLVITRTDVAKIERITEQAVKYNFY